MRDSYSCHGECMGDSYGCHGECMGDSYGCHGEQVVQNDFPCGYGEWVIHEWLCSSKGVPYGY